MFSQIRADLCVRTGPVEAGLVLLLEVLCGKAVATERQKRRTPASKHLLFSIDNFSSQLPIDPLHIRAVEQ
jgi:hypothetical protein